MTSCKYVDAGMKLAIDAAVSKLTPFFTQGTFFSKKKALLSCAEHYFGTIALSMLDEKHLVRISETIPRKEGRTFNQLLLGLSLSKNLPSNIGERIIFLENEYLSSLSNRLIVNTLRSPVFDELKRTGKPFSADAVRVFSYYPEIKVADDRLRALLENYLFSLANDSSRTFGSRKNYFSKAQVFINAYLTNVTLSEITLDWAIQVTATMSRPDCTWLKNILYYICKHSDIDNQLSEKLENIWDVYGDRCVLSPSERLTFHKLLKSGYTHRLFCGGKRTSNPCAYMPEIDDDTIFSLFKAYVKESPYLKEEWFQMADSFASSLEYSGIKSLEDISLDSFLKQVEYYRSFNSVKIISFLCSFYSYALNTVDGTLFKGDSVSPQLFSNTRFPDYLYDGFCVLGYNPVEHVPEEDKWVLCFNVEQETNNAAFQNGSLSFDFSKIQNADFRFWAKSYIWKSPISIVTKKHNLRIISDFLNYINDLKTGKQLSIYTKPNNFAFVTESESLAYKTFVMSTQNNNRTINGAIYIARCFLVYVRDSGLANIPTGTIYYLTHTLDSSYSNSEPIPDEDLMKIASVINSKAQNDDVAAIYQLVFYLALETEFRGSQILSLPVDCVKKTAKKNQFVLVSKTKTSAGDMVEQAITIYAKRHIDEIIRLTDTFRSQCQIEDINKYLFVIPAKARNNSFRVASPITFAKFFRSCCRDAGTKNYSLSNLRDTHMTKAEEYVIRKQLSDIEQNILSGHKSTNVDTKHYVNADIREMLESVNGIIIGDVDINGQIAHSLPPDIVSTEHSVSNQCGYCTQKSCSDFSCLSCLMCKDFVTLPNRLPYFKEQIKILDEKIKGTSIAHDKEDLIAIKRLHVRYIEAILNLEGGGPT